MHCNKAVLYKRPQETESLCELALQLQSRSRTRFSEFEQNILLDPSISL